VALKKFHFSSKTVLPDKIFLLLMIVWILPLIFFSWKILISDELFMVQKIFLTIAIWTFSILALILIGWWMQLEKEQKIYRK
jgi:positive regulator of sigma E activity